MIVRAYQVMLMRLSIVAVVCFFEIGTSTALAAQADAWKAEWDKTVEGAKREGQLTIYGSPDFEALYGEFHKKYPEIKITGVFNRGADAAKRLMAERRADKFLADVYLNGLTTGYNVFYKAKALDPIPPCWSCRKLTILSKWWQKNITTSTRKVNICSTSTAARASWSPTTPSW
jgi:hypothetical protein